MSEDRSIVDEPAQTSTGEALREDDLRLYLGPNPGPYVVYWERARKSGHPFVWGWNWWGLLFPIPWLFYRKIWAVGAAVVMLPVLLDAMLGFGSEAGIILATLIAAGGKALVIERAERKSRAIDALGLLSQDSIARLRRAGGVSRPGAAIGALMMLAVLILSLYDRLPARLPGCAAPIIRKVVLDIARDNAEATGLKSKDLRLERIRQTGIIGARDGRLCHAELRGEGESLAIEYDVIWRVRGERRFFVDLRVRGN